ncbi:hypothetical protein D1B31_06425 [Neobacillus notoginsengisoli]|uniref:YodN n=1 Tax=Neobacillus notoginsengisoli TaxID=1578198 RepID=A0A417YXI1_9BACI|nr:hypothetical protein [Neobacillus notoginsengisoli]RHW42256.1 hypothetical protein D1B31_06425 [Neobacillus notoginsengisoli]
MEKRKKPKYAKGDTVVILMYGTVGKVTDIKWMGSKYAYEINNSEGLYVESSLQLLSEYDGTPLEQEHLDIEYKFFFGDLVQVKGYGNDLFRVVGVRTEIWRYKEDAWEDIIYELARVKDGEWLEAGEEELTLLADAEHADTFIKKLGFLSIIGKQEKTAQSRTESKNTKSEEAQELEKRRQKRELVDSLLDIYNDYRILHQLFGDREYAQVMEVIVKKLQEIHKNDEKKHV